MPPNVLLVVLDSVRARNTTLHGHHHDTTPFLASLADDRATVYEQARAPAAWSLPSHASLFTGTTVAEHGFTDRDAKLRPSESVWTDLAEEGYETGLFTSNPYLTEVPVGLDAGFETVTRGEDIPFQDGLNPREFVHEHGRGEFATYLAASLRSAAPVGSILNGIVEKLEQDLPAVPAGRLRSDTSARTYTDRFLEWHDDRTGPWAACINFMDAHTPYAPGDSDRWGGERLRALQAEMENQVWEFYGGERPWWQIEALSALYDGAIRRIDAQIRRLIETLAERNDLTETLLVVTGDHGEGFGEFSPVRPEFRIAGHQARGVDETLLHVPLLVKYPGQQDPSTVSDLAALTRFPPVVEAALDGTAAPGEFRADGPVLASSFGIDEQKQTVASQYCDSLARFHPEAHAVYENGEGAVRKYVTWGDHEATVRIEDVRTVRHVSDDGGDRVREEIERRPSRDVVEDRDGNLTAATRSRLEDLGYV